MKICVFSGSNFGSAPEYKQRADELGVYIAKNGHELVYGGTDLGLMGAVSQAASSGGAIVTGVIPMPLQAKGLASKVVQNIEVTKDQHERKARMATLSDGFIALPGGVGTYEEFFEIWTWGQLGIHNKPLALMNTNGFYNPLINFLNHAVDERFMKAEHRDMVLCSDSISDIFEFFKDYAPHSVSKWY